jgi:hypothetical protein
MKFLEQSVVVKQWALFAMLLLSGYAAGAIIAKLMNALGI